MMAAKRKVRAKKKRKSGGAKGTEKKQESRPVELKVERIDQIRALAHPLRQRIFERMAREPCTTKQVAVELGEPPTRLYHHVGKLEQAGLIELVETRKKRGTTEKFYSTVADRLRLDPTALWSEGTEQVGQAELGVIDGLFQRSRAEIGQLLQEHPDVLSEESEAVFAWAEVHCAEDELPEFQRRLEALMTPIEGLEERSDRKRYRLILGFYPLPGDGSADAD